MTEYNTSQEDRELEEFILKNKIEYSEKFSSSFNEIENTVIVIETGINHCLKNHLDDIHLIYNIAGFIAITSYDLKITGKDMLFASQEWQKRHYSRNACIIIHDSIDKIYELLGRNFHDLTSNRLDISEVEDNLKMTRSLLKDFKKKNYNNITEIRNTSAAHRDINFLTQIGTIKKINWSETIQMVMEFNDILNQLGIILQALIHKIINALF